jgi:hypothetical protein
MKRLGLTACVLALAFLLAPAFAQGNRGKAELTAGGGNIVVDYGRPSLKGRDMLSQLKEGSFWRMGMNQATTLTTPVDLTFGGTKIAKGSYSIWLLKSAGDKFELVFNSQTGQWGTQHDASKDVSKVALTKATTGSPVEVFTIELKDAPKGGAFVMTWGSTSLSAAFESGS